MVGWGIVFLVASRTHPGGVALTLLHKPITLMPSGCMRGYSLSSVLLRMTEGFWSASMQPCLALLCSLLYHALAIAFYGRSVGHTLGHSHTNGHPTSKSVGGATTLLCSQTATSWFVQSSTCNAQWGRRHALWIVLHFKFE